MSPPAPTTDMSDSPSSSASLRSGSVVSRLLQGVGVGVVSQVLSVLSRLVLPPLFLKAWGVELYGDWLLISAVVANLALSEVGGSFYVVNRLTQFFAADDERAFRETVQTALLLFTAWPAVVVGIFVAVTATWPELANLKLQHMPGEVSRVVSAVLALQVFFTIPQGLVLGIYRAVGAYARGAMMANYLQLLQMAMVAVALLQGTSVLTLACLQMLPVPLVAVYAAFDLNRTYPRLGILSVRFASRHVARQLLLPSAQFFLIHISLALSVQGTVMVAGYLLGSVQVVVFSTMRTLSNVIKAVLAMVSHAAWPDLMRLDTEGQRDQLAALFNAVLRTNVSATVVISMILLNFGREVYQMWLGKVGLYQPSLMTLFMLLLSAQVVWGIYGHLLMATNRHKGMSVVTLLGSVVSICAAYVGALHGGMRGMLMAMIAAEVFPMLAVPWLVYRYDPRFSLTHFLSNASPLLLILPMAWQPWTAAVCLPLLAWWWWAGMRPFLSLDARFRRAAS
jgi:O-antigen/teichoic acid export membrane protein